MSNQYTPPKPPETSWTQVDSYLSQDGELIRCLKKLCHQLKRANRLSELNLYIRLAEIVHERESVFGDEWAAMMWGLEPQKRKRKKRVNSAREWGLFR